MSSVDDYDFQWVAERSHYIKKYNKVKTIRNQQFLLNLNKANECIVSLSPWIIAENSTIVCKKANTIKNIKSTFTEYVEVDHTPTKAQEIYFDREMGFVQFYPTEVSVTDSVVITFQAIGLKYLYGDVIATRYDSRGNVLETFNQLVSRCRKSLDALNSLYDASTLIDTMNNYIKILTEEMRFVKNSLPELTELYNGIKTDLPDAKTTIAELQDCINSASTIINTITQNGNAIFNVYADDMWYDVDEECYTCELEHNLGYNAVIWEVEDVDGNGVVNMGCKSKTDPQNVFIVKNDEKQDLVFIANKGYTVIGA